MDDIGFRKVKAESESEWFALQYVNGLELPQFLDPCDVTYDHLGPKLSLLAIRTIERLRQEHADNLPELMGIALRESWYACAAAAWFISLMIESGDVERNDYTEELATVEGYAQTGWTIALVDSLLCEPTIFSRYPFGAMSIWERPDSWDILDCIAVYWLGLAEAAQRTGKTVEAFDWVFEANSALEHARELRALGRAEWS